MAFWSGETLKRVLPGLIVPFNTERLDCASYHLSVGVQAFVTTDKLTFAEPDAKLITVLSDAPTNLLTIPPGQFAFLLTHESVEVPNTAIALISMRARYKFRGLINVSGFHVDPGFKGHLIFSVYNAGPSPITVKRGEALFLIVYADLDGVTSETYEGGTGENEIPLAYLANLTSQVFSPQVLRTRLDEVYQKMGGIETKTAVVSAAAAVLASISVILIGMVTIFPSWPGVVIARSLDAANYEIKQKADLPSTLAPVLPPASKEAEPARVNQTAAPASAPAPSSAPAVEAHSPANPGAASRSDHP